jgi:hypothetical protein
MSTHGWRGQERGNHAHATAPRLMNMAVAIWPGPSGPWLMYAAPVGVGSRGDLLPFSIYVPSIAQSPRHGVEVVAVAAAAAVVAEGAVAVWTRSISDTAVFRPATSVRRSSTVGC